MSNQTDSNGIKAVVTKDERLINGWVKGEAAGGITFSAKIFDESSVFGINKGRVSKLEIRKDRRIIVNYDRGWDKKPETPDEKAIYKCIMSKLKALDKVFAVDEPKDFLAKIEVNKQKVNQSAPVKHEKNKGEELC